MSVLEEFVAELERVEADEEMYFSVFYIPEYYQPLESILE